MTTGSPAAARPQPPHASQPSRRAAARRTAGAPRRLARAAALALLAATALAARPAGAVYAIAQYGEPKYPPGFTHFDYVNPDAPKGGTLVLANPNRLTSFDKFNPYTMRGNPAPGIDMLFESLVTGSSDEPASAYGLLADDIAIAPDGLSVTFHLNPAARFSNGDPVTAADVVYSFDTLKSPQAAPQYPAYLADLSHAVAVDAATVRFAFRRRDRELPLIAGSLPVFSRKWGLRPDGTRVPFDQLAFQQPIGSGPYVIDQYDSGRTIRYKRSPNYWGARLPVRIGTNNFDRIVYKLYGDPVTRLEAFKAGEYDVLVENIARNWVRRDVGKAFDSGELIKREFRQHNGAGMQGFVMNQRRPMFRDARVRQALDLALDFEWLNRQLFYGGYTRIDSFFADTDLQATGTPGPGELAILNPLRAQLDPAVFGPMPVQPNTNPPGSLRANLLKARALLAQAGWTYRDGALRNAKGEPFVFEILDDSGSSGPGSTMEAVINAYIRNLAKLGIVAKLRIADYALLQKRFDSFDFDMTTLRYPAVQVPGSEQALYFASRYADQPGSSNLMGVKSPALDAIVKTLLQAQTREQLLDATHALDRVLMHGYYVVPQWYSNTHRIAYKRTLAYPARLPLYYAAEGWVPSTWWALPGR
ncbi:extracellular solute-binding protein [Burkholderia sp. FERM BP-3421]|uniref:extracellular solute-binding protein n=1 Tax=Burkholderia sp. FERM BP-3421 TaxID=1494466 RepID=UPI002362775A|nr:extracellular solute-binding protein [Burkholderia sp. FERM BP-3421]WDD93731.1 extracellular solute-binding protein [Burkholderia sp. FERM BP-3421]